jgi:2-aminoadipate transaminase
VTAEGVAYIPGGVFSSKDNLATRFACASPPSPPRIDEGVARLKRAVDTIGAPR